MSATSGLAHYATVQIEVDAATAFDFLADPLQLGTWSLGCMYTRQTADPTLFTGTSLYDDSQVHFQVQSHRERLLIDYCVGTPGALLPRISARVVAAAACDLPDGQCLVSLQAWRSTQMTDARWLQLCSAHEAEIWLIKSRLEMGRTA